MQVEQIEIGTCVPGHMARQWLPHVLELGFECVALNFHMSLHDVRLPELAKEVMPVIRNAGARVASVGFYCNPVEDDEARRTLESVIDAAPLFDAPMVSTFAGAFEGQPVEKAVPRFGEVFRGLGKRAADRGLKIAIENCPMGGSWQRATCNIAFNPRAWEMMFEEVPDKNVGLEWEPGHQSIQLIDPVAQLREWAPTGRILHMHGKDCTVDRTAVARYGVFGAVDFALQRTPGFGETDWRDIFTILHQAGYASDVCVEGYHDPVYRGEWEMTAQKHALEYLRWCRGGDFIPNPWKD